VPNLDAFRTLVKCEGVRLYRDLPWRRTHDPYTVFLSEVMLQQTQVARVAAHWDRWLNSFPTLDALAAAPLANVLEHWQGMGYNRRAINLKKAADKVADEYGGILPRAYPHLLALPGVGPSTAAGVCVFAYGEPQVYLETNVRTVFLHHLFEGRDQVPDREIIPLVCETCDPNDPRGWYYALLDYGSHLKKTLPNPSRRSKHHSRQSAFEGSLRQKRAALLRLVLAQPGVGTLELTEDLSRDEHAAARATVPLEEVAVILTTLEREGFLVREGGQDNAHWRIP